MSAAREVILYTRSGCGLCDETAAELRRLSRPLRFSITAIDVDGDEGLRARYNDVVPAVEVGGRIVAQAPVDGDRLRAVIEEALR